MYGLLHRLDDFAGQASEILPGGRFILGGDGHVFNEDCYALNWFTAEWSLGGRQLEAVRDLVG